MDDDGLIFPKGFMDISERKFLWIFQNKKEFVDFTLTDMKKPTKLFLKWKNYCLRKSKV